MVSLNRLARELGDNVNEISSTKEETRPKRVRKSTATRFIDLNVRKSVNYARDFDSRTESEQWDRFYSDRKLSDTPFYGLSTGYSAVLLHKTLNKSGFKLFERDIIVEVGHGKHPLVDSVREVFKVNNIFIGIEFSSIAIKQAIDNDLIKSLDNTQFVTPDSIDYYGDNGDFDGKIIHSTIGDECKLKKYCAKLVVGRCVLDYITSRLLTSVSSISWEDDPRLPKSIVTMFNAFTNTLQLNNNSALVFIEPFDKVKVRDHILTLFKVLCISTFVEKGECRFLKLNKITTDSGMGIICYTMIKTEVEAKNYDEIYTFFTNATKNVFKSDKSMDADWLLPIKMPSKWSSGENDIFDVLTSFNSVYN